MNCSSPNQTFQLRVSEGIIDRTGEEAERVGNGVTVQRDGVVQFEKDLRSPTLGAVANDGTTVVIEGKNWDKPAEKRDGAERFTTIYVYDRSGTLRFERNLDTRSVMACAIDGAGTRIAVGGVDGSQIAIYHVATGDEVVTTGYDAIDVPSEITTSERADGWLFEITDRVGGDPTSIQITTAGDVVAGPETASEDEPRTDDSQEADADETEPVSAALRDRGHPVPEAVYGLVFATAEHTTTHQDDQLHALIERGPVYEPSWGDYTFIIPATPKILYVVGVDSTAAAATAFNRLCDMEQIDLSNWYQVTSTSGTAIPSSGDFERAVRTVTRTAESDSVTMDQGGIRVDEDELLDDLVRREFYGGSESADTEADLGAPKAMFPATAFGDRLRKTLGEGTTSESTYKRLVDDVESDQIVATFPALLNLLERGTVFGPYSIDLRNRKPSVQPVFNEVARRSPETIVTALDKLEIHLQDRTSRTAAEVACRLLRTLVEAHPDRFEALIPTLRRLWESKSAHPRRRVLDVVATAFEHGDPDVAAVLNIEQGSTVRYLLARMAVTESAWLRFACCRVILATDLDDAAYDYLATESETLIETVQFGRDGSSGSETDRRTKIRGRSLYSPAQGTSTDDELLARIRSSEPSAFALYRLHKQGAGPLLEALAAERPEAILSHLDALMADFTATGSQAEQVRTVAKQIVRAAIESLPKRQYGALSQYDEVILPLLESSDHYDVVFALEWTRRSASEEAIDALAAIHADPSHDRWQQATAILDDIAPDRVDADREPNNARTRWTAYVSALAAEQGQLPASGDMRERADTPVPPHWKVFDGWQDVLDALNIETTYRTSNAPLRGCLIEDLQRVAQQVDGAPTTGDIAEYSEYTYTNFKNEFGGIRQAREIACVTADDL